MSIQTDIKTLIFDWDGTLADSTAWIVDAVQFAFANADLSIPSAEEARQIIGLSLENAMLALNPNLSQAQQEKLILLYRQRYFQADQPVKLYEGVYAHLQNWQNTYILGVATGKSRRGLERALDDTHTRSFFTATRTVDECASKPAPDMILSLCDDFGVNPNQALMIGDTVHDLLTAHNAGAYAVGIANGAHTRQQLESVSSLSVFDDFEDFAVWFNKSF